MIHLSYVFTVPKLGLDTSINMKQYQEAHSRSDTSDLFFIPFHCTVPYQMNNERFKTEKNHLEFRSPSGTGHDYVWNSFVHEEQIRTRSKSKSLFATFPLPCSLLRGTICTLGVTKSHGSKHQHYKHGNFYSYKRNLIIFIL